MEQSERTREGDLERTLDENRIIDESMAVDEDHLEEHAALEPRTVQDGDSQETPRLPVRVRPMKPGERDPLAVKDFTFKIGEVCYRVSGHPRKRGRRMVKCMGVAEYE